MATQKQWATLKYFSPSEFENPESTSYQLLVKLDHARAVAGVPFRITSSTRTWPPGSSHIPGLAVDVSLPNPQYAYAIIKACLLSGIPRIIIYSSHVHLDVDYSKSHPLLMQGGKST